MDTAAGRETWLALHGAESPIDAGFGEPQSPGQVPAFGPPVDRLPDGAVAALVLGLDLLHQVGDAFLSDGGPQRRPCPSRRVKLPSQRR